MRNNIYQHCVAETMMLILLSLAGDAEFNFQHKIYLTYKIYLTLWDLSDPRGATSRTASAKRLFAVKNFLVSNQLNFYH